MNKIISSIPDSLIVSVGYAQYLLFSIDDIVTNGVRDSGFWEKENIDKSVPMLKNFADGIVLDIGANLGSYSVPLALDFPQLEFHAFEPQRVIFYQLCANIVINRLDNVYSHNYGLSSHTGKLSVVMPEYCTDQNIGGFSLDDEVRNEEGDWLLNAGKTEDVELKTLDSLDYNNVRLIKIDVEGLELEVLKGATQTIIKNGYPPIIFEAWTYKPWYMQKREELFNFIESLGYAIDSFGENNVAHYRG
jgi:FkbM family methyltransferase